MCVSVCVCVGGGGGGHDSVNHPTVLLEKRVNSLNSKSRVLTFLNLSGPGITNSSLLAACFTVNNIFLSFNKTYLHGTGRYTYR